MKLPVPHIKISLQFKERHILEVLLFIAVLLLLHRYGIFHFVLGILDKAFLVTEDGIAYFVDNLVHLARTFLH